MTECSKVKESIQVFTALSIFMGLGICFLASLAYLGESLESLVGTSVALSIFFAAVLMLVLAEFAVGVHSAKEVEEFSQAQRLFQLEKEKSIQLEKERALWGKEWENKLRIEARLQRLSDSVLPLFDGMPRVTASLSKESSYEGPSGKPSLAYGGNGGITIKKFHYDNASRQRLLKTIKHEMVHCWIHWKGIQMDDPHGHYFRKKVREVGAL